MVKIGILTFHRANNYGAILQGYSLFKRLKALGDDYDVKMINVNYSSRERSDFVKYNVRRFVPKFKNLKNYYDMKRFIKKHIDMTSFKIIRTEEQGIRYINKQKFDLIITGSDEVWKKNEYLPVPNIYWLPHRLNASRMSFAATNNRTKYEIYTEADKKVIKDYLEGYELITVRDDHTKNFLKDFVNKPLYYMCDPTFLIDFEEIDISDKLKKASVNLNKPVIAFMGGYKRLIDRVKDSFGNAYEYISFYQAIPGTKFIGDLDPLEFASVFKHCNLVITSFFHGTVFSIINGKPFISVEMKNYDGMESKIQNLLKGSGMEDRYYVRDETMDMDRLCKKAEGLIMYDDYDYETFRASQRQKFEIFEKHIRGMTFEA